METQERADSDKAEGSMRLRDYLRVNCYDLKDYRLEVDADRLRGLGAIDGNVNKLESELDNSIRSAERMVRLLGY